MTPSSWRRRTTLVAPALLLAACAQGGWDGRGTEAELQGSLLAAHPGADIDVRCADRVETGDRCTAIIGELEVELRVTSLRDGAAGYAFTTDVVRTQDIADVLAERLDADLGGDPTLRCEPGPLVIPRAGDELRCEASTGERRHVVVAEFTDDGDGAVRVTAIHPHGSGGSKGPG